MPDIDESAVAAKCDFCMAWNPQVMYVVTGPPMLIGGAILTSGEWGGCGACVADLWQRDFAGIFARWSDNTMLALATRPDVRPTMVGIWTEVWDSRTALREATVQDKITMIRGLEEARKMLEQ